MVALSVVAAVLTVSPATAAPSVSGIRPAPAQDVIGRQDPAGLQLKLTDFKTWLINQPGLDASGYIESVNHAAVQSTTLLWKGSSPLQAKAIAEGAKRGITVTIEQRTYGRAELQEAALAAFHYVPALGASAVSTVSAVTADFDGITVYYATPSAAALKGAPSGVATAASQADAIARQTGVATRAAARSGFRNSAYTRQSDIAPFNAGGFMYSPSTGHACSSGFGIRINGVAHTTTARHCIEHDYRVYNTVNGANSYGDGLLNSGDGAARVMTASGSALMFDGAWSNSAGYKKTVTGFGDVSINDLVCTSGAMSGVHCGLQVKDLLVTYNDHYYNAPNFWTIRADSVNNTAAGCTGDSGGPVFTTVGTSSVHAVGMIQAVSDGDATASTVWTGQPCGKSVLFTSMRTIVNTISGATLRTN